MSKLSAINRTIIVIDIIGDGVPDEELNKIAGNWYLISMPRGDYQLHPKEVEQLLAEIHKVIMPYTKNGRNGG